MKPYLFPNSNQIRDCVAKSEFNHLLLAVSGTVDVLCGGSIFLRGVGDWFSKAWLGTLGFGELRCESGIVFVYVVVCGG